MQTRYLNAPVWRLQVITASNYAMRVFGASQIKVFVWPTPDSFFHFALLINICTFNKRFGGQTDEVS